MRVNLLDWDSMMHGRMDPEVGRAVQIASSLRVAHSDNATIVQNLGWLLARVTRVESLVV